MNYRQAWLMLTNDGDDGEWYKPVLDKSGFSCGTPFVHINANSREAALDGHFTAEMLDAIALYLREPDMVLAAQNQP